MQRIHTVETLGPPLGLLQVCTTVREFDERLEETAHTKFYRSSSSCCVCVCVCVHPCVYSACACVLQGRVTLVDAHVTTKRTS